MPLTTFQVTKATSIKFVNDLWRKRRENGRIVNPISGHGLRGPRPERPWIGWIGSAPAQMSGCSLGGGLSWLCDDLLLVVVVLRLFVVPRKRSNLKCCLRRVNPLRIAADREEGEASWRQVGLGFHAVVPGVFSCLYMYMLYVCVYIIVCICMYEHVYMYIYACVYVCMYIHVCMGIDCESQ